MRFDKFTTKFQQALSDAQSLAVGHDNQIIEPLHLLLALLAQEDGGTVLAAAARRRQCRAAEDALDDAIDAPAARWKAQAAKSSIGRDLANLLNLTDKEAQKRGDQFIACEMFLLALADDKGDAGPLLQRARR